jgi:hypothetical protein
MLYGMVVKDAFGLLIVTRLLFRRESSVVQGQVLKEAVAMGCSFVVDNDIRCSKAGVNACKAICE